jgi:hypothetical protein
MNSAKFVTWARWHHNHGSNTKGNPGGWNKNRKKVKIKERQEKEKKKEQKRKHDKKKKNKKKTLSFEHFLFYAQSQLTYVRIVTIKI